MANIPKRVADRLVAGIKRYQPILASAKSRDIGEADTVTIVKDLLADVFGYDKYSELTSEYSIRGTYCDLATKIEGTLQTLIEVKAVGLDLKDQHVKQAIDYAANQGVDWVLLTNGMQWRVYHVVFAKPIGQELIVDIDFCALNPRSVNDVETLFLWCKEGWQKSVLGEYRDQRQALSRFSVAAVLQSEPVVSMIRRELRRLSPDIRIETEEVEAVLINEVLKRDVLDGDQAAEAKKKLARALQRRLRDTKVDSTAGISVRSKPQPGSAL
jgi:predicted type IV restriction endonuclease